MKNLKSLLTILAALMLAAGITTVANALEISQGIHSNPTITVNGVTGTLYYGEVVAVSGATITISAEPNTYTVDVSSATFNGGASLASVVVGDKIATMGTLSGTTITASSVWVSKYSAGTANMVSVVGKVTAINGNTITVTGSCPQCVRGGGGSYETYSVDATNATIVVKGGNGTIADIAIDNQVTAMGKVSGTTIIASRILLSADAKFVGSSFFGKVTAVSGNTITLEAIVRSGTATTTVAYTVDAANAKVYDGGVESTIACIAVADQISVVGTLDGVVITATVIKKGVATNTVTSFVRSNITPGGLGSMSAELLNQLRARVAELQTKIQEIKNQLQALISSRINAGGATATS